MRTFVYRGYDASGRRVDGLAEASSAKAAREQLVSKSVWVESLEESDARQCSIPASIRSVFYRELASLLNAGLPLVAALSMLLKTSELAPYAGVIASVRDEVRGGGIFAQALERMARGVSAVEVATLSVAERTATMAPLLKVLADELENRQAVKSRLQQALIYPALVFVTGIVVALVMLGVLIPRIQALTGESLELPVLTRIMIGVADFLFPYGVVLLGILCLCAGIGLYRLWGQTQSRVRMEHWFFRLPLLGGCLRYLLAGRFARTLGILTRSGASLVEGIPLAAESTGSVVCGLCSAEVAKAVRHGKSLEQAIATLPLIGSALSGWIAVGETGGDLVGMLDHAAERCERQFDRVLSRLLVLVEPALLLLIGGFVLLVTLSVILPVFSMTNSILQ